MPNTIAHLGVNLLATRAAVPAAGTKWILAGALLPDLPWILQRLLRAGLPEIPAIDLRLYVAAQASLLGCLLLAGAIALLTRRPRVTFAILALGALLHLVLDALQTKLANGVLLLAPVDWTLWNAGLFWPEDWPTLALTLAGLAAAVWMARSAPPDLADLRLPGAAAGLGIAALLGLYLAGPLATMSAIERGDAYSTATLRAHDDRTGRTIEIDRNRYDAAARTLTAWTGEGFALTGTLPEHDTTLSLAGRFVDPSTISVERYHEHPPGLRDGAATLGIAFVAGYWLWAALRTLRRWRRLAGG